MKDSDIKIYDIAIIGLGPAGALFASLLNSKFSVVAFDKKSNDLSTSYKKPCGGLLAPDAQKMLLKLGLELPENIYSQPRNCKLKVIDLNINTYAYFPNSYINIDRHRFDIWLKSKIPSNVNIIDNSICTDIYYDGEYYIITVICNKVTYEYKSKYLIGADGASSIVRKKLYPRKKISSYLSVQQWFDDVNLSDYICIFDSKLGDCYSWGIPKGDKFILGGAFSIAEGKYKFECLKNKLQLYEINLGVPVKTEACIVLRPSNPFEFCCGNHNAFLIGESAGFISPSSLDGISYALESAYILSNLFNFSNNISSFDYQKATFFIKLKLSLKLLKNFFIYNQFFRYIFFKFWSNK